MKNFLEHMIEIKQKEIEILHNTFNPKHPFVSTLPKKNLKIILQDSTVDQIKIIAEIKRASPSKGNLAPIKDAVSLAQEYRRGGANAISILTENHYFFGNSQDLQNIANAFKDFNTPLLRKDFIIDPIQLFESRALGANAILLIACLLKDKLASLLAMTHQLGLEALVEVHSDKDVEVALNAGAEIIGINNRNLHTLEVNPNHALQLLSDHPELNSKILVAESAILHPTQVAAYKNAGFSAVLIGEALVTTDHPSKWIKQCHTSVKKNIGGT